MSTVATAVASNLLQIDRSVPFDPVAFIGTYIPNDPWVLMGYRWSIIEQDDRSLALTQIDLNKVTFEGVVNDREFVKGHEKLRRLIASGKIRLDARVLQTLWENQHLIPESWRQGHYVFFYGTILRAPGGDRYVLCMYWYHNEWRWACARLEEGWYVLLPSACLAN